MIEIEILSVLGGTVTVAFYVEVPLELQLATAADTQRRPRGSRLTQAEKGLIAAGKLIEVVKTYNFKDPTADTIQAALLAERAEVQQEALANYSKRFSVSGLVYRDGGWQ